MGRELEGKAAPRPSARAPPSGRSPGARTGTGARRTSASGTTRCWPASCSRSRTSQALVPRIKALPAQRIAVDRPLLHDAAALVDAGRLRAGGDRDLRAREPEGRVPAVPGRRADLDEGAEPLLRRRGGLEAAAGPARRASTGRTRTSRASRRLGRGLAEAGAKVLTFDDVHDPKGTANGLRDRELAVARETGHDRDRGEPAPGRRPRPRALPVPRRHPHDRAVPSADGEAVAGVPRRRAGAGAAGEE